MVDTQEIRVLLCDDQLIVGAGLRAALGGRAHLVIHQVVDPTILLAEIERFKPTVILQDLVLPNFSGVELVRAVRADDRAHEIPIVLLSSTDDSKVKLEAFEAGASDYIVKFPESAELWGRISYHSRAYYSYLQRDQAARALEQKGRIEALGSLAAGIAHEINTPLQYIGANLAYVVEGLQRACSPSSQPSSSQQSAEMLEALQETIQGVQQISSIVRAMKAFAHPGKEEKVSTSTRDLMHDVELLSRAEWRDFATCEVVCEQGSELVTCSPGGVAQVLLNLVVNAGQAIRSRLDRNPDGDPGRIRIAAYHREHGIAIDVSDNGGGIPESVQKRLYEPFFTTKSRGKGSGQGLALSRSIVEEGHGGTLSFVTTPGLGTTFTVYLPQEQLSNLSMSGN